MTQLYCARCDERLDRLLQDAAANRAEHASFKNRLNELEESSKRQSDILVTLQRQADAIERMNLKIDGVADSLRSVAGRVTEMEREPGERWKKIGFEIIKYMVLAAVGAALGYCMK